MYELIFDTIAIYTVSYAVLKYPNNNFFHIAGSFLFGYYTFKYCIW